MKGTEKKPQRRHHKNKKQLQTRIFLVRTPLGKAECEKMGQLCRSLINVKNSGLELRASCQKSLRWSGGGRSISMNTCTQAGTNSPYYEGSLGSHSTAYWAVWTPVKLHRWWTHHVWRSWSFVWTSESIVTQHAATKTVSSPIIVAIFLFHNNS